MLITRSSLNFGGVTFTESYVPLQKEKLLCYKTYTQCLLSQNLDQV